MAAGDDVLDLMSRSDRATLARVCDGHDLAPEQLIAEIVAAYLRLIKDVPEALPRNPMASLHAGARRRGRS